MRPYLKNNTGTGGVAQVAHLFPAKGSCFSGIRDSGSGAQEHLLPHPCSRGLEFRSLQTGGPAGSSGLGSMSPLFLQLKLNP
jgi:hypothetical protein